LFGGWVAFGQLAEIMKAKRRFWTAFWVLKEVLFMALMIWAVWRHDKKNNLENGTNRN